MSYFERLATCTSLLMASVGSLIELEEERDIPRSTIYSHNDESANVDDSLGFYVKVCVVTVVRTIYNVVYMLVTSCSISTSQKSTNQQ